MAEKGRLTLALVLHAHLPYVRHPEHEGFLEEDWLHEAVVESYLPLLMMLRRLEADDFRNVLAFSISPTLAAMLADPLLVSRTEGYMQRQLTLASKQAQRGNSREAREVAAFYEERLLQLQTFHSQLRPSGIIGEFARLEASGVLELFTTAATHAFLPFASRFPEIVRAQVELGVESHRRHFGRSPSGFWLPECAYEPGLERYLAAANIRWFVLDAHGLLHGSPRPLYAVYRPVFTPSGPAAFARDREASSQVWSAEMGYPGDPRYRDFYRDLGWDLSEEELAGHLPGDGSRRFTGLKTDRVTGRGGEKLPYDRRLALQAAEEHAAHFVQMREARARELNALLPVEPIQLVPFDAELFGHWWFEGPEFLESVLRRAASAAAFQIDTPSRFLARQPEHQIMVPSASSWGDRGYWEVWLQESNAWIYPHLHFASVRLIQAANRFLDSANPWQTRVVAQLGRELMLAQASDWAFLMRGDTAKQYATERTKGHLANFRLLNDLLERGGEDFPLLESFEARTPIFPEMSPRTFLQGLPKS